MSGDWQAASQLEVLLPVMAIYLVVDFAVIVLSCSRSHWWFRGKIRKALKNSKLFEISHIYVAELFVSHPNNPASILKMLFPAMMSLAWCPAILFIAPLLFESLWPDSYPDRPDVNEGIGSFLGVAGLICAITYGYAFDGALKQRIPSKLMLRRRITSQRILLDIVEKAPFFDFKVKIGIIHFIKRETISWMKILVQWMNKEERDCVKEFRRSIKEFLIDNEYLSDGDRLQKRAKMADFWDNVETITKCNAEAVILNVKPKVTALHWVFLIVLGYVCCIGIMFVTMSSYQVDLMFSLLFVIIIFIFLCLVADMDNPVHGCMHVNLKEHFDFLKDMDKVYSRIMHSYSGEIQDCAINEQRSAGDVEIALI